VKFPIKCLLHFLIFLIVDTVKDYLFVIFVLILALGWARYSKQPLEIN